MIPLSPDPSLHYEIPRILSAARYHGADIAEVLQAASSIDHTNLSSQAQAIDSTRHPVSARDVFFVRRRTTALPTFTCTENPSDSRINELRELRPGAILAIYYAADNSSAPKPTVRVGTGYDGSQEEILHVFGFLALERGYNVITYEGPGKPLVHRTQNLGFITEWEKVVTPVVDYLVLRLDVGALKNRRYRPAAFEHRIVATIAVDGIYDLYKAYSRAMPPPMLAALESGERGKLDDIVREALASDSIVVSVRWGIEQGLWSFNVNSASEWMEMTRAITLKGTEHLIQCLIWVGEAESDQFFHGQPEKARDALGDKATYVSLTSKDAAGNHCHVGAQVLLN
ncbi:2,6-dihydropseudooxynicotine hydrolase [Dactylonectria macrodidyma]|uniref:2,6-dihydropseudooxynicotine hydrolase n=1 Tax=Dactylonectria macrodidyma TaxID=307937 RepID=A0A9P9EAW7_9HYPO|nr:2,6-dihydropseudooxynicotine hydrolase [Dactylonectria macrodidyma]